MAAVISIVFTILLTPSFIPTANAVPASTELEKPLDFDPFLILEDEHDGDFRYSEEQGVVYKVVDSNEKEHLDAIRSKERDESNIKEYEESLNNIRENYIEIENEIGKLEKIKEELESDILNNNAKQLEAENEIINTKKEIEELKEKSSKKLNMFHKLLISGNMFALVLFFIFSKGYKLKKEGSNTYRYV